MEMKAKRILIRMLENERAAAQAKVNEERTVYRGELLHVTDIENQLDPRNIDALSSDFGNMRSSSPNFETDEELEEEASATEDNSDGEGGIIIAN